MGEHSLWSSRSEQAISTSQVSATYRTTMTIVSVRKTIATTSNWDERHPGGLARRGDCTYTTAGGMSTEPVQLSRGFSLFFMTPPLRVNESLSISASLKKEKRGGNHHAALMAIERHASRNEVFKIPCRNRRLAPERGDIRGSVLTRKAVRDTSV